MAARPELSTANGRPRSRRRPRASSQRGFSLVEMVIAIFLSGLVVMAAFHIQSTFQSALHRQDEITRIQHTMKVTRHMLERKIRPAGAGMMGATVSGCGFYNQVGPFIIHNRNTFNEWDNSDGGADDDPDWFEVAATDMTMNGQLTRRESMPGVAKSIDNAQNFPVGTIFGLQGTGGTCLFVVTHNPGGNKIQHRPDNAGRLGPLAQCFNDAQLKKDCRDNVLQTQFMEAGSEVINFSAASFALRVDRSAPDRPMLMMASGVMGGDPNLYPWEPVAENVEDMQIGVYLDTSNPPDDYGDVWLNSRDLTEAELNQVRAVRISLVFRSASEVTGWRGGLRPALEDRPAATVRDGYIRRVLTTEIKLRNLVTAPGT